MRTLDATLPIAESIQRLLYPYAEVVIHSIPQNTIFAIFNPFSGRAIGDDSLLSHDELSALADSVGPYEKTNWDGRRLKSVSSVIRNNENEPIGLMCINVDVSTLLCVNEKLIEFIFPKHSIEQPEPLFKDDWQERINVCVHQYLLKENLSLDTLKRNDKKILVEHLRDAGAFSGKNAAKYIANVLDISRATVYKYLNINEKGA